MRNRVTGGMALLLLAGLGAGCNHLAETRAITAFTASLEKGDIEQLRALSSPEFRTRALRHPKAVDSLKILRLPTGETKIVAVDEDNDPNKRKVTVEIGEAAGKKKVVYDLVKDSKTGRWMVDDIHDTRKPKPGQEKKSVAQQADLLNSNWEFLDAWGSGRPERLASVSTGELRDVLAELPAEIQSRIAKQVTEGMAGASGLKPEVEGHADRAVVRIERRNATLQFTMKHEGGRWLVDDVGLASGGEASVPSVRRLARAHAAVLQFYAAYLANDKAALKPLCNPKLFTTAIEPGDLALMPLPACDLAEVPITITLQSVRGTAVLSVGDEIVQFALVQPREYDEQTEELRPLAVDARFLIDDVSVLDSATRQERRLISVFTSHAAARLFQRALAERDKKGLQLATTPDFHQRVWSHGVALLQRDLPAPLRQNAEPQFEITRFQGPITELTANLGDFPVTYVLREHGGRLLVDDVLIPAIELPASLKKQLELMVPVRIFARALETRKLDDLKRTTSVEFNRLVWAQTDAIPPLLFEPVKFLQTSLRAAQVTPGRAVLTLGDARHGAKIHLLLENERYVIDDVLLIAGVEHADRTGLKQQLRSELIYARRQRIPHATQGIAAEDEPLVKDPEIPADPFQQAP